MATFLIVPGARHGGWGFRRVKVLLEAERHEVFAPSLTGLAERSHLLSPEVDLDLHIRDILAEMHYWDLHDVILVGHSYGGMVITGVADRAPERLSKLVFLDATTPVNGQSMFDLAPEHFTALRADGTVVDGVELVMLPDSDRFHGVEDPADQAWMRERLTGHPWKCVEQPLVLHDEAAIAAIPQFHIVCTLLEERETKNAELMQRARAEERLWVIPGSHDLMITDPEKLAAALLEIAAR